LGGLEKNDKTGEGLEGKVLYRIFLGGRSSKGAFRVLVKGEGCSPEKQKGGELLRDFILKEWTLGG